jgi:DNA-binding GntR family transcriptional regulator
LGAVTTSPLEKNRPLYQKVYKEIKKAILTGKIKPGSKIIESVLAQQLQISRTPLREAFRQLQKEGLLVTDNISTTVIELKKDDFEHLHKCRLVLEKEAIESVVNEITNKQIKQIDAVICKAEKALVQGDYIKALTYNSMFHELLLHCCTNVRLVQILDQIRSLQILYRANNLKFSKENMEIIHEHRKILEVVKGKNVEKVMKAMESHLTGDYKRGLSLFFDN